MNPIHFTPNVPQVLSLKDTAGVIDGFNVAYETSDGRLLLLPYPAAIKLNQLDPQPGEEVSILKTQGHRLPAEWVFALTPKSEQARAEKETQSELERQLADSLVRCSDCKEPSGRQHKISCHRSGRVSSESDYRDSQHPAPVRQMPKSARSATSEAPEQPKGTGTYGPVPQVALATRKPGQIPFNLAFKEVIAFVCAELKASGEQWSEESRQDLTSTVLIAAAKAGYVGVWER